MATASEIITDSLGEILVSAAEQPVTGSEMSTAIRFLNRMMAAWSSSGLALGFTVINSSSDTVTIPDGAIDGVVASLAVRLAPQYDVTITAELMAAVKMGMNAVRDIAVTVEPTQLPCTMPIGSGNEYSSGNSIGDRFYPCPEDTALTEEGGKVLLEDGT